MFESAIVIFPHFFDKELLEALFKLLVAAFCGLVVGTERTLRGKSAGIRTNILICLGSALFMVVSENVAARASLEGFKNTDPARIAAQVVTGIGFIGAGTILRNRGLISGLTSAASIWVVAAIGLASGAGLLRLAVLSTLLLIFSIEAFGFIIKKIRLDNKRYKRLTVLVKKESKILAVRKTLRLLNIAYTEESTEIVLGEVHYYTTLYMRGSMANFVEDELVKIRGVKYVMLLDQIME